MKKLIVTAIDNNDDLWYEHVIPFLLTLKKTDYQGDVGVINYGLSQEKIDVLTREGYIVFAPLQQFPNMLIDRQVSTAQIAEQYGYAAVALIDADIWFPQQRFSLFEQLRESDKLYCSYDIWRCTFLTECVEPEYKAEVNRRLDKLIEMQDYVWQAGVIAGTTAAWRAYWNYATECLYESTRFKMIYGIDATILNLYAIERQGVAHLPKKYNCLPAWGVYQHNAGRGVEFRIENEAVEALHVSRAHRKGGEFSFNKLYPHEYFEQGKALRKKNYPYYRITQESILSFSEPNHSTVLRLVSAETDGCFNISIEKQGLTFPMHSFLVETAGISTICLQNPHNVEVHLSFSAHYVTNYKACEAVSYKLAEQEHKLQLNKIQHITLAPQANVTFLVKELNVEDKRIRWAFQNLRLIA